jgi:cyanophycinase
MKNLYKLLSLFILLAPVVISQPKGHLFIIGGGEAPKYMVDKFVELAGGADKKIVIFPMASSEPLESAIYHRDEFMNSGCKNIAIINCSRNSADDDSNHAKLDGATGIYFGGGDQSLLTAALLGTKLLEKVKKIYLNGGVIGGTSAGAAVMSKIMITGNEKINKDTINVFKTIQKGNVEFSEGFGFLDKIIIDQHFIKRKRLNRLLSLVLENPKIIGVGIDESTAIITSSNNSFEVFGESSVIIFDARKAANIKTGKNDYLSAKNIIMHILSSGEKYKY